MGDLAAFVLAGEGVEDICGCWPDTETAMGWTAWVSGHRRYPANFGREEYSLTTKPMMTKARAINTIQMVKTINLLSCCRLVLLACSIATLASRWAAAIQLSNGTKLSANQFFYK